MPVDDEGHLGAVADSVEEAIEWYEKTVLEVEAGEHDERIRELLESIPPRKRRN